MGEVPMEVGAGGHMLCGDKNDPTTGKETCWKTACICQTCFIGDVNMIEDEEGNKNCQTDENCECVLQHDSMCMCIQQRCALPPTDETPFEIACCGFTFYNCDDSAEKPIENSEDPAKTLPVAADQEAQNNIRPSLST